jgi:hypothetical protein
MPEKSPVYEVAEQMHAAFYQTNETLTEEELYDSGVTFGFVNPNKTEKLYTRGEIEGEPAYQTFSRDRRGYFHITTTYTRPGGPCVHNVITPNTPDENAEVLTKTLFMQALVRIVQQRAERPR